MAKGGMVANEPCPTKLRELRKRAGLTAQTLAEMSRVPVQTIEAYERGLKRDCDDIRKLDDALTASGELLEACRCQRGRPTNPPGSSGAGKATPSGGPG
jgi:transcriptional regulator with XRE-family HTH domain